MEMIHPVKRIVDFQKKGIARGIYSVCSANRFVIEAAMEKAFFHDSYVLIEATANQVNQFGGYTGMRPEDFRRFTLKIAEEYGFPEERIIIGGDHVGPVVWKSENSECAMEKACELIRQYVMAGFTKIHIDTSMRLGDDDKDVKLDADIIARRGAVICKAAEEAFKAYSSANPGVMRPVYVIGSEVPVPGGNMEAEEGVKVTDVDSFRETKNAFKTEFIKNGLQLAWENVIAVVVQPGVEFGDDFVHEYDRNAAKELTDELKRHPGLVFEGHSTDYQNPQSLKNMVEDGIKILKVGPALTFALREGLFLLNHIEEEIYANEHKEVLSGFISVLEAEMDRRPDNWIKYYHGKERNIMLSKKFSYSDRCRYYLPLDEVVHSLQKLFRNLRNSGIPMTLLSQYMPLQYGKVRRGLLRNEPEALLKDKIGEVIDDYYYAIIP